MAGWLGDWLGFSDGVGPSVSVGSSVVKPARPPYSRVQMLDIHQAMARAIARHLATLPVLDTENMPVAFGAIYDHWPDPEDAYVAPCTASVMAVPYTYSASQLTPSLIESTWEPKGLPGQGLYKLAECEEDFEIRLRCPSSEARSWFVAALETAWVNPSLMMAHPNGGRYGISLNMPEYWGLDGTFKLKSAKVLDNEDNAMRKHREASIIVSGVAAQVKLGPVQPMKLTVTQTVILSSEDFCP
jgi:hypothetical protein